MGWGVGLGVGLKLETGLGLGFGFGVMVLVWVGFRRVRDQVGVSDRSSKATRVNFPVAN